MKNITLALAFCCFLVAAKGQEYELKSSAELYRSLKKLEKGQRALYLAAHPDDENTRLIAWLENEMFIETAYLSLTRGDGGQNLIGGETGDALGVIRTNELLQARATDGGEQYFTRAVDFGYSKSAEESFEKWGKEEVLHDVVWAIRKFQPHIVITRFPPTRRAGHGHHEASAILAAEAFELAADPNAFPEQLEHVRPWQVQSLYYNTSSWWNKDLEDLNSDQLREKKIQRVNVGRYDPLSGMTINEIASLARSRHRCQAFGTARDRGERFEYLEYVKGDYAPDIFEKLSSDWDAIGDGAEHLAALQKVIAGFRFEAPYAGFVPYNDFHTALAREFEGLKSNRRLVQQAADLRWDLLGLRMEAFTDMEPAVKGSEMQVKVQVYNASEQDRQVFLNGGGKDTAFIAPAGKEITWVSTWPNSYGFSSPYWLKQRTGDLYSTKDYNILGKPNVATAPILEAKVPVTGSKPLQFETYLHRKWTDRSIGELVQPFASVPAAFVTPESASKIVPEGTSSTLYVRINANEDLSNARLEWTAPEGWEVVGNKETFSLSRGQVKTMEITVKPNEAAESAKLAFVLFSDQGAVKTAAQWISYEHIPEQVVQYPATVQLIPLNIATSPKKVLYVEGSGDETDEALERLGYQVDETSLSTLSKEELQAYDVVLVGIRGFNTNEQLVAYQPLLMDYVEQGGLVIVQYNTTYGLLLEEFGPYPMKLGRERVTEEDSDVKLLEPKHPIFNVPNEIEMADFEGWVQERGLYFASEWDEKYKPLIAWHDTGEEDVKGGLLVAEYGKGAFIYTGISFFRELPAGVKGAYKLFINLVEYEP